MDLTTCYLSLGEDSIDIESGSHLGVATNFLGLPGDRPPPTVNEVPEHPEACEATEGH
jgi:hypothetical protein